MRVDLPDGHWADLRDKATHRDVKDLLRGQMGASQSGANPFESGMAIRDNAVTWMVTGWSYPVPIPSEDPNSLDDMDGTAAEMLIEAVVAQQEKLVPSMSPRRSEESPTTPSAA